MQRQAKLSLELGEAQSAVFRHRARFRVLVAGRRFGKSQLAFIELLRAAWQAPSRNAWYVAPSYRQAKRIAWKRLKDLVEGVPGAHVSETELTIQLANGSTIALRGADYPDALRGNGLDFVVLDEFASMKPEVWTDVLRPALADRKGGALFIGTPQGHNHLYDRFEFAREAARAHAEAEWAAFHFTTLDGGFVTAQELAGAAQELDERLFRQEFEASFENTAVGRAYHAFSRGENVVRCAFRPGERLIWSLDFNVHPMSSVIAQVDGDAVSVLDELSLENANTVLACEQFWNRIAPWRQGQGPLSIDIYGDASGHQRRTCGTASDWGLIREFFAQRVGQAVVNIKSTTANPGVRDRINIVNSRLCSAAGERKLFVDPKCAELILDLERVVWRADECGQPTSELDKSDRRRTHMSDALGYYVAQAFALRPRVGEKALRLL